MEDATTPTLVHCFQHSDTVRPLSVADWARARGHELRVVRVDLEPLPSAGDIGHLVVLGGAMNTDQQEEHPWLAAERALLRELVSSTHARILGICLGSQLLAEALGATVSRARVREVGWQRVQLTDAGRECAVFGVLPESFDVFEWHGDEWELPDGAEHVVTSAGCPWQAFTVGSRITAVQFHPEFTYERVAEMAAASGPEEFAGPGHVQQPAEFLDRPERFDELQERCFGLLDRALAIPVRATAR